MAREPLLRRSSTYRLSSGDVDFEKVVAEERGTIADLRAQRVPDGQTGGAAGGTPFALAFSGGGVRAAAFHCGVLWRLAEANLLKDVTYMTAVSGGGYIAMGFATHCLAAGKPRPGEVYAWYRRVVASTIVRMQQNAGNFVRDFNRSGPCLPGDNSGCTPLPRVLDVLILVVTLTLTILVHPVYVFLCFMAPMASITEAYFGDVMRRSFCDPIGSKNGLPLWWSHFVHSPEFASLCTVAEGAVVLTLLVFVMTKFLPPFKDPNLSAKKGERVKVPPAFLFGHGLYAFLIRFTTALLVFMGFLLLVLTIQVLGFSLEHGSEELLSRHCPGGAAPAGCLESGGCLPHLLGHISKILMLVFVAAALVMPYTGSHYLIAVVCLAGPALIILLQVRFTQYRVFGPYTKQDFFPPKVAYDQEAWERFEGGAAIAMLVLLPLYPEIRAVCHTYYLRCLSHNFFADGEDKPLSDLLECPYCPFTLVTGTSSDYKPPIGEDDDVISELSFTALHCGSIETGYVPTLKDRTIGKCTALTGAGCIDAAALTLSSLLTMRFWLEALNLSWGDYIIFNEKGVVSEQKHDVPSCLDIQGESDRRFMLRLAADSLLWLIFSLVYVGHATKDSRAYLAFLVLFSLVLGLSFFAFGPILNNLSMSPFLRQLQQATAYCYRGERPPPLLYVTDGGCRDCTTLVQLVLRRQERILLSLAASDPTDDLAVLKTAMEIAEHLEYASFYNPVDPRQNVSSVLAHFKLDKSMGYIQIGISYPETPTEGKKFGHLFIVKNRLPPEFGGRVEPHITEEEVRGEVGLGEGPAPEGVEPFDRAKWGDMSTVDLGPFCCCDCTHYNGANCGPKFPHGAFSGFLYLTPMWCSSLARLSYRASEAAVAGVSKPGPLGATWEKVIDDVERQRGFFVPGVFNRWSK